MTTPAQPAEADRDLIQIPHAIHDYQGRVMGSEVISEDGVFCPHCGRRQPLLHKREDLLAQCGDCAKWFHWGREVTVLYVSSTMSLHRRPR